MGTRFFSEIGHCSRAYESREHWEWSQKMSCIDALAEIKKKKIEKIAYHLWLSEGKPENCSERHWLKAEKIYEDAYS